MPLIDLKSDLSLPIGADQGQKILGRPSVTAIARDVERVTKFLISPKGLLFTAKQFALQMMNPNVENIIGHAGIGLTKIYDPISPITNTAGASLGLRTDRHMPPIVRSNGPVLPSTYEAVHKSKSDLFHLNNRLINLKNELLNNKNISPGQTPGIGKILTKIREIGDKIIGFRGMPIETLSGLTGPQSVGGIGATTIRRYVDTRPRDTDRFHIYDYTNNYQATRGEGSKRAIVDIDNGLAYPNLNPLRIKIEDVQWPTIDPDRGGAGPSQPGGGLPGEEKDGIGKYKALAYGNMPTRIKSKNPISIDFRELRNGKTLDDAAYEKEENRKSNFNRTLQLIDTIDKDPDLSLIDFSFNDIAFKAYIGQLSDNFAPSWDSTPDQGRADPRYQYSGFERTISFDFIVVAYNPDQLELIWNKLQKLAQLTHPVYGSEGFYGQSVNVTIGKLFDDRPMIIQDLGYDWDNETPWEIDEEYQSPLYTRVTMTCVILGDRPQSNSKLYDIKGLS